MNFFTYSQITYTTIFLGITKEPPTYICISIFQDNLKDKIILMFPYSHKVGGVSAFRELDMNSSVKSSGLILIFLSVHNTRKINSLTTHTLNNITN